MTETDVVGSTDPNGAGGNQPPVSQGNGQPISPVSTPQDFVSKKDFENAMSQIKGLQSRQDKSTDTQARFMDEIRAKMSQGMNLDQAEKAVNAETKTREQDDLLKQVAAKLGIETPSSQYAPAGTGPQPVTVDKAKTLQEYGLSENDPDVAAAISGQSFNSVTEVEAFAGKVLLKRQNKPQPDLSASIAATGSTPDAKMNEQVAEQKYEELGRLLLEPTKNKVKIASLKKELSGNGYPV